VTAHQASWRHPPAGSAALSPEGPLPFAGGAACAISGSGDTWTAGEASARSTAFCGAVPAAAHVDTILGSAASSRKLRATARRNRSSRYLAFIAARELGKPRLGCLSVETILKFLPWPDQPRAVRYGATVGRRAS
jgi:hypothetical protein